MRAFVLATALVTATTAASAADVNITCTETGGQVFIGTNMFPPHLSGPWNFTITQQGLKTPWGGNCGLMTGEVTGDRVSVTCAGNVGGGAFKKTVVIDRQLGTYREDLDLGDSSAGHSQSFASGTCQKRETF